MHARKRAKVDFWIEVAGVLIFCSLIAAWFIVSSTRPLDSEDLAIHAGDLRSLSAAGSRMSEQYSNGELTDTFFEEQLALMNDKIETARETLESSNVEDEARPAAERVKQLSSRVDAAFDGLSVNKGETLKGGRELKDLAVALKALEDDLKKGAEK